MIPESSPTSDASKGPTSDASKVPKSSPGFVEWGTPPGGPPLPSRLLSKHKTPREKSPVCGICSGTPLYYNLLSYSRAPLIPPPRIGGPAFLLPIAPVLWRLGRGRADICAELCTDGAPGAWEDAANGTRPASCFHLFRLEAGLCPYIAGPAPSASAIARALLPKPLFTGEPSGPIPYAPPCCACTIGHNAHRA